MNHINPDRIRAPPNSMGIVWYYIVPCIGNQGNDSDSRYCNYRISRKSFASECMNRHKDLCDRMAKNCTHDSVQNLSVTGKICDSVLTIAFDDTSSFCVAAYSRCKHLQRADQRLLSGKIRTPVSNKNDSFRYVDRANELVPQNSLHDSYAIQWLSIPSRSMFEVW